MAFFGLFGSKGFNDISMKEIESNILQTKVKRMDIQHDLTRIMNSIEVTLSAGESGTEVTNVSLASDYEILSKEKSQKQSQLAQINKQLIALAGLKGLKEQEKQKVGGIFGKFTPEKLEQEAIRVGEQKIKTDKLFEDVIKATDIGTGASDPTLGVSTQTLEFNRIVEERKRNKS